MKSEMIFRNVNEIKVTFTEWLHPERIEISKKTDKIEAFEYFVTKVYDMMGKPEENDLSISKLQFLLFLTQSASLHKRVNKSDIGLLKLFDNWIPMAYGHMERDILKYHRVNDGEFNGFKIKTHGTERYIISCTKSIDDYSQIISPINKEIDDSLSHLLSINPEILNHTLGSLSEIVSDYSSFKAGWYELRKHLENGGNNSDLKSIDFKYFLDMGFDDISSDDNFRYFKLNYFRLI